MTNVTGRTMRWPGCTGGGDERLVEALAVVAKTNPLKIDELIRSRRKSVALIVDADGRLVVRAPLRLSKERIQAFVDEHADWVEQKRAALQTHPPPARHRFKSGELFHFLGQPVRLELVPGPAARQPLRYLPAVDGAQAVFELSQPAQAHAEQLLSAWYRAQARQVCSARAAALAKAHSFSYTKIRISSARTRWGSCSSRGTLSFTWRLVMLPPEIIDYVVLHELVHTLERNHGQGFWKRLASLMPDYPSRRAWLKQHGAAMVF